MDKELTDKHRLGRTYGGHLNSLLLEARLNGVRLGLTHKRF